MANMTPTVKCEKTWMTLKGEWILDLHPPGGQKHVRHNNFIISSLCVSACCVHPTPAGQILTCGGWHMLTFNYGDTVTFLHAGKPDEEDSLKIWPRMPERSCLRSCNMIKTARDDGNKAVFIFYFILVGAWFLILMFTLQFLHFCSVYTLCLLLPLIGSRVGPLIFLQTKHETKYVSAQYEVRHRKK